MLHRISEEQFTEMQSKVMGGVGTRGYVGLTVGKQNGASGLSETCRRKCSVGSNPAPSPYKSKWDEAHAYLLVLEKQAGLIRDYGYETMTLKLAQGKYHRPDYTVWHLDGTIELRQIKGYHKNLRASLTALKWAAQKHPWYRFTLWRRKGQGWDSEAVII